MPAVNSRIDPARRTAVITTAFDHPAEVVWSLFSDPTRLARWWGPPGMPMSVDRHDLTPGGAVELTVTTGRTVTKGRWAVQEVDPPHALKFTFSSDGLEPTEIAVEITPAPQAQTLLTVTARFASDTALANAIDIGFVNGVARSCTAAHTALAER